VYYSRNVEQRDPLASHRDKQHLKGSLKTKDKISTELHEDETMSFQHSSFAPSALFRSFLKIISAKLEGDMLAASLGDWSPLLLNERVHNLGHDLPSASPGCHMLVLPWWDVQRCPQRLPCWNCWKCHHYWVDHRETVQQLKGNIRYYSLFWNLFIYCLLLY